MARKPKVPAPPEFPMVVETFSHPGHDIGRMRQDQPSCWNGVVSIRRYRVTAEEIAEPVEVLASRLQHLWDVSDNYHHSWPLQAAAKSIGYTLTGDRGGGLKP